MADLHRVQVLLDPAEALRFERFCRERGHKKSTLIARLIREHLDKQDFEAIPVAVPRRAIG